MVIRIYLHSISFLAVTRMIYMESLNAGKTSISSPCKIIYLVAVRL